MPNVAETLHRIEQYTLRAAPRPDRLQPAFANTVVDGSPGDAQHLRRVVERHAAADTRFQAGISRHRFVGVRCAHLFPGASAPPIKARRVPGVRGSSLACSNPLLWLELLG